MQTAQQQVAYIYNDGGRAQAGYKGVTGDCVVRAIAIATEKPYQQVYDELNALIKNSRQTKTARKSSSRTGICKRFYHSYLENLGWEWVPVMKIGTGCTMHLRKEELPKGRLIVRCSRHLVAVIDGVIHDNHDSSRDGIRCVYGYFRKAEAKYSTQHPQIHQIDKHDYEYRRNFKHTIKIIRDGDNQWRAFLGGWRLLLCDHMPTVKEIEEAITNHLEYNREMCRYLEC